MKMKIVHAYSDNANIDLFAYCYSLEEAFDEKIRALAERSRPRDLYDVYPTNLKIPFGSPEMSHSLYHPLIEIFEAR